MKRGISPLIATVLLIGATILIASIVSTFIISQTKKFEPEKFMGESSFCQDVVLGTKVLPDGASLQCVALQGAPAGCDGQIVTNLVLVNKGSFTIKSIDVKADGLGSGYPISNINLKPGKSMCETCVAPDVPKKFLPGFCKGKNIRIIPHISVEDKEITCTQSEMIINANQPNC